MRHSSVKSIVAALSIVVTLSAAAPTASAAARNGARQTVNREAGKEKARTPLMKLVQRVLRRIGINSGPQVPIPTRIDDETEIIVP